MELTSARNPLLQKIRRAAVDGRPTEDGLIVAEGPHLLEEAYDGHWTIEQVLVTPQAHERYRDLIAKSQASVTEVSERALNSAAATGTPQNILALLRPRVWSWSDLIRPDFTAPAPLVIVLDRIQDPGNLGTIVRSAEAFGATGLIFLKGCAHVANGKALRASAGSLFRTPFLDNVDGRDLLEKVQSRAWKLYALTAQAKTSVEEACLQGACALLVGSEGSGVAPELLARAQGVSIPSMKVESLNAAVACSIALYEASRQRNQHESV